jgi:hypothetical protein
MATNGKTLQPSISALERVAGSADWSRWTQNRWCYYDYVRLNPLGTNLVSFFTTPLGQNDPVSATVKTQEQTNLTEVRSFGRVNFLLKTIRTHIRVLPKARQPAGISADADYLASAAQNPVAYAMEQLCRTGVFILSLGQKEYMDIPQPFINCPPAFGIDVDQVPAIGANLNGALFMQDNSPEGIYNVKPEQLIEAGQTIQASMVFENGNTPVLTNIVGGNTTPVVEIGLIFDGFILRPVQ